MSLRQTHSPHIQLFDRKATAETRQSEYVTSLGSGAPRHLSVFQAHGLSDGKVFSFQEKPLSLNTDPENKTRNGSLPQKKSQKNPIWKEFN